MCITADLPRKQARASPDKTPGCYPWVPVSCYGVRDGWFPRNGVWNPARPRGFEVSVLYLRVWQSFHFFADFRPKLFVKKPGKINKICFFFPYLEIWVPFNANKVWIVSWCNFDLLWGRKRTEIVFLISWRFLISPEVAGYLRWGGGYTQDTGLAHILCRIYVQMCFKSQHLRQRNRRLPFRPIKYSACKLSSARTRGRVAKPWEASKEKENISLPFSSRPSLLRLLSRTAHACLPRPSMNRCMWKSLFSVLLITFLARRGSSIHTKKLKVHKQTNTTLVACSSVVIPNESAVILATVNFKAMTSCLEMLSSFSMDSFSCWRFFLALFSTSISNSCFSWSDRISSSALLIFTWRSRIFAAACETSEYRIFCYRSKFWPFLGY